jgi:hypothetical protein
MCIFMYIYKLRNLDNLAGKNFVLLFYLFIT